MKNGSTQGQKRVVLYVVTKSNFGGAQRAVLQLAQHLDARFEPIVAFGPAPGHDRPGSLAGKLAAAGIQTRLVPDLGRDVGFADFAALRALTRLFREVQPAVVHLHSSKAGGLGALAARMSGVPRIIFTAHGWPFREARNPLSKALIWLASVATVFLSHQTICVSESGRRALAWLCGSRLVTIRNAIEPIAFFPRAAARAALGLPADGTVVGSIAELTANKNIALGLDIVADAMPRGLSLDYCIIGDGEQRHALEEHARDLGIAERVRWCGFVEGAARYLTAFDVLLLPSRKEGLPFVMLEAHQAGVPVIASAVGGMPEAAAARDMLCRADDRACFVSSLMTVLTRGAGFARGAQHGPSLETVVRATEALYE